MHDTTHMDICELREKILNDFKNAVETCGMESIGMEAAGETVDMIKDLAQAESYIMKAAYYKSIVDAMEEAGEHEESERMGYNNRRYSSGRYAPKGKGMRMGYQRPYMYDEEFEDAMRPSMRMGYVDPEDDPMMSHAYNEYRKAKRHYTETKAATDKSKMEEHAMMHLTETMQTMREIWKDADPAMRKKMKTDLTGLLGEMPV